MQAGEVIVVLSGCPIHPLKLGTVSTHSLPWKLVSEGRPKTLSAHGVIISERALSKTQTVGLLDGLAYLLSAE